MNLVPGSLAGAVELLWHTLLPWRYCQKIPDQKLPGGRTGRGDNPGLSVRNQWNRAVEHLKEDPVQGMNVRSTWAACESELDLMDGEEVMSPAMEAAHAGPWRPARIWLYRNRLQPGVSGRFSGISSTIL